MNTRALNQLADVICRAQKNGRVTPAGIAVAVESAGMLMSPETAAELERLRAERAELIQQRDRIADDTAKALADRDREELERLRARVAELEAATAEARPLEDDPIRYTLPTHPAPCRWPDSPHCLCGPSDAPDVVSRAAAEIAAVGSACVVRISYLSGVVRLTLRPRTLADWTTWLDLLDVDAGLVTNRGAASTARGSWNGVPVVLTGEGVGALQAARFAAAEQAAES